MRINWSIICNVPLSEMIWMSPSGSRAKSIRYRTYLSMRTALHVLMGNNLKETLIREKQQSSIENAWNISRQMHGTGNAGSSQGGEERWRDVCLLLSNLCTVLSLPKPCPLSTTLVLPRLTVRLFVFLPSLPVTWGPLGVTHSLKNPHWLTTPRVWH